MLKNGFVAALTLLGLSLLIANVGIFRDAEFLQVTLSPRIWPVIIVAVVFGLINGMLVPMVKRLFERAVTPVLFILTLVVDAGALMLTAWLAPNSLYIGNWATAFIMAAA
ncbi:MAG: phage holin family protein, partial [Defluviitaleaceae bacterium]|nr:phage holin family protein [Defluviitaleaceae bacterium]